MTNLSDKFQVMQTALELKLDALISATNNNTQVLGQMLERLDTSQSQNGSANTLLTDIRNALGTVSSNPANYTVKRLLDEIHTCLCGELGIDDDPTNPTPPPTEAPQPPTVGCTDYARVEAVSYWQNQGTRAIGGVTYNVFAPMFNYNPLLQGWNVVGGAAPSGRRAHRQNQEYNPIVYCIVWNFTGDVRPFAAERATGTDYNQIADAKTGLTMPFGHTFGTQMPASGFFGDDFPAGAIITPGDGARRIRYCNWPFLFPASVTEPPLAVWLRYRVEG